MQIDCLITNKVRDNDPVPGPGQHWDHLPVEEGPGRFAVETENRRAVSGSLVKIVNSGQRHPAPGINTGNEDILYYLIVH